MKTLQDNIDIMQALIDGKTIQAKFRTGQTWDDILNRNWSLFNFANYEYRIKPDEIPKPEPTLLERIEAKWPDKRVIMLGWYKYEIEARELLRMPWSTNGLYNHYEAQSMKGFFKYVYSTNNELLTSGNCPNSVYASYETIAALFDRD